MNNNNFQKTSTITKNDAKIIVSDETQKLIFCLNRTFPNDLQNEKLDLIALLESLERRIIKEISNNDNRKFLDEILNN